MLIYYNIAMEYNPRVWISAKFPVGLFPKLNKVDIYMGSPTTNMFADVMGNKVDVEGVKDKTITAKNIDHKIPSGNDADGQAAFILNNCQETSKIFIL